MSAADGKHVFVSYVHEDNTEVDQLCAVLEAAQVPYFRDRKNLGPGDAWRAKIRDAIRTGALVFLACFSASSRAKEKSHMNEELTLAIEEFRKMPPGRTWLIPIRFDGGDVPEWDLGAGRTLRDLNYVDLFGPGYPVEVASLVTTIHNLMGEKSLGAAAALEVVEQATAAGRTDLMRRLTKEMVVDPARRIELDDLVSQEVRRILQALTDLESVVNTSGSNDERLVQLASAADDLWELTKPFCASLQVAARWSTPDALTPWSNGLQSFVQAAVELESGREVVLKLRHLPGMVSLMTAGLACVSNQRWENLKALVVDQGVSTPYDSNSVPVLRATHPWEPFDDDLTPHILARSTIENKPLAEALKDFTQKRVGKFYSPVAEWLHASLQPIFSDQWHDENAYAADFDRAEVMLGLLDQDAVNRTIAAATDGRGNWFHAHWFGRSTWRAAHRQRNPLGDLQYELESEGESWRPLRAGLFGGDVKRAEAAVEKYAETFAEVSRNRH